MKNKLKTKLNKTKLRKYYVALIIGESTGTECTKIILNQKGLTIRYIVSTESKYDRILKRICDNKNIFFLTKSDFKKKRKKILKISQECDLLISIYSSITLDKIFLESFNQKCFNFHPGILPYYPGKNCVSGAIFNSEKYTGVTLHLMNTKVDQGKIVGIKKVKLSKRDNLFTAMFKLRVDCKILLKRFLISITSDKVIRYRKNLIMKKKFFPKYIPNNGHLNLKWNFRTFVKIFNAGNSGPYNNTWGKLYFISFKKKKIIKSIISSIKNHNNLFIQRKTGNIYKIGIKNKIITVETFN